MKRIIIDILQYDKSTLYRGGEEMKIGNNENRKQQK